jgi:hypothetical protein
MRVFACYVVSKLQRHRCPTFGALLLRTRRVQTGRYIFIYIDTGSDIGMQGSIMVIWHLLQFLLLNIKAGTSCRQYWVLTKLLLYAFTQCWLVSRRCAWLDSSNSENILLVVVVFLYIENVAKSQGLFSDEGMHRADCATPLYPQKLALTSPTSGGRSVGIVHLQTQAMQFVCFKGSEGDVSSFVQRLLSMQNWRQ